MEENSKVIAAIGDEIGCIKKQLSQIGEQLSRKPDLTQEGQTDQKDSEETGQMIVDLSQKLDQVLANQKIPNFWLTGFGVLGVCLGIEVILKTILNYF